MNYTDGEIFFDFFCLFKNHNNKIQNIDTRKAKRSIPARHIVISPGTNLLFENNNNQMKNKIY